MPGKIPAILPILVLLVIMITNYVLGWGQEPHIPVLIACVVAMIVGRVYGFTYKEMLAGALTAVRLDESRCGYCADRSVRPCPRHDDDDLAFTVHCDHSVRHHQHQGFR